MSRSRPSTVVTTWSGPPDDAAIRLDLLGNPHGSSLHVLDALAGCNDFHVPAGVRTTRLRYRLAETLGVAPASILLGNGLEELLSTLLLWRRSKGQIVLFPPSDVSQARRAAQHGIDVVTVRRGPSFGLDLDPETAGDLPRDAMALVDSPSDPTGSLLGTQEAVRLSRACDLLVVDERHVDYGGRSLVPLVREFENIVVLRTFETWAGLGWLPLAYAIGPARLMAEAAVFAPPGGPALGAVIAAAATLDDWQYMQATLRAVRAERSRLFRMLRKLNMLRPFPSWANFLLARIERGETGAVVDELARRGIVVHRPPQPELRDFVRISATRSDQTDALRRALTDMAGSL